MALRKFPDVVSLDLKNLEQDLKPPTLHMIPNGTTFTALAYTSFCPNPVRTSIIVNDLLGRGTFGRVYKARLDASDRCVALKQVACNLNTEDREPKILYQMNGHCNIVRLIMHCFVRIDGEHTYMLMAMEHMPMTLLDYLFQYHHRFLPRLYVRVLSYQMFRGLAFLHSHRICHRDIKPDNMLVDPTTMHLKLADFGSAKHLEPNGLSATYICSRVYRAPELLAKYESYSTTVDIWSAGCVLAEMLKGTPLFRFEVDQLQHIILKLGTEGLDRAPHVLAACVHSNKSNIIFRSSWETLLDTSVPQDLAELLNSCLIYNPEERIAPIRACAHASYDELRTMDALETRLPNGSNLPPLFNFSNRELDVEPSMWMHLLPLKLLQLKAEIQE